MTLRRILPLLFVVLGTQLVPGSVFADEQPRPNILFMLTDDQRFDDLGCMGNKLIQTPNLDKLAGDGVIFNNAFVTTAICCSSRASILTGQHMRRHGIFDFATPLSSEAMDASYPVLLRNRATAPVFWARWRSEVQRKSCVTYRCRRISSISGSVFPSRSTFARSSTAKSVF